MLPALVPAAIMGVKPYAGTVIAVAVIAVIAAHIDADAGRVRDRRSCDSKRRCRRECVSELSHLVPPFALHGESTTARRDRCRNFTETLLERCYCSAPPRRNAINNAAGARWRAQSPARWLRPPAVVRPRPRPD